MNAACPYCGANLDGVSECRQYFEQMLFWENEHPEAGEVHNLLVLNYHLQHPHLYSAAGLEQAKQLLVDFAEGGVSTKYVRQRSKQQVSSTKRQWHVTARPDDQGAYAQPVSWTFTAQDVVAGGYPGYIEKVQRWSEAILRDLRASGNL